MTHIPLEWKSFSLGKLCKFVGGGTPNMANRSFWSKGTIPWVSPKDMKSNEIWDTSDYITEEAIHNSSTMLVPINSVLVVTRSGILKHSFPVVVNCVPVTINQDIKGLLPNGLVRPNFLAHNLRWQSINILRVCAKRGTTVESVDLDALKGFEILLPPIGEQVAIESVLACCDRAIDLTQKLIGAKTRFKRGLMQQLLTGKKRFPEFEGQSWKKFRIRNLFEEVRRYIEWDEQAPYKLVSIRRRCGGLFFRGDFYGHQIKVKKLKSVRTDDFLISKRQVAHGAWSRVTPEFDTMKVSDEYDCLVLKNPKILSVKFFNCLAQMPFMQRSAFLACNGVHIEKLIFDFDDFGKEIISIPPTLEEQSKIAAVLEAADKEIELLTKQLELLKLQKKGLMQKLLTGQIRVKTDEPSHAEADQ